MGWLDIILGVAAAGLAVATVVTVVKVTKSIIAKKAKEEYNNAIKIKIKSKNTKRVNVGIFDRYDDHLGDMSLEGNEVSSDIRVGDVIYC
ncbi:MAG: hypothetical protein MJZ24_09115 [Paludibacteraceae bacterium]|nr:hypothetical protein [Paludibacteraceae bacterium]